MQTLLFILVFLLPPACKPAVLRLLGGARIGQHVQIGWFVGIRANQIVIGDYSEIRPFTIIQCDQDLRIGSYSIISSFNLVYGCASLVIGDHSYIGPQSLINCDEPVTIGNHSALGARSMVYTHGSYLPYTEGYWVKFGPVTLGDYTWCAAGVFIHPGITIGNRVFVNSRSVVNQDLADGAIAEGVPARTTTTMDRLQRTMTPRRLDKACDQMIDHYAEMVLRRQFKLQPELVQPGLLRVTYRNTRYHICTIPSHGQLPAMASDGIMIALVNHPDWNPEAASMSAYLFRFDTMTTPYPHDPLHRELDLFMRRYYGVQFRYTS